MQPIFEYIDFRKFLSDYYQNKKETSQFFSYRYFAQKIGINSPSFLKSVIEGKRNLTSQMSERFSKALGLKAKEKLYFQNLVLFNQSKILSEKQQYYLTLKSISPGVKESVLNTDQFDYFVNWYAPVIRELICANDFRDDYRAIAAACKPAIQPAEVKTAVELLLRLKLVEKQTNGTYKQTATAIVADESITSMAVRSFTRTMIDNSKSALDTIAKNKRHISGITMGISQETYAILTAEIEAFKDRVKNIVNHDTRTDAIYQITLSLFPVSEQISSDTAHLNKDTQ
ncbi:MAG TPA: TIGR02147 family protein [Chitinispirillaceae bacterium]|nr:TIGR02147 family protein [Chitinispirillaceae bacterium]